MRGRHKRCRYSRRNSASGTYGYFKEHALAKGDYKDTVKEQPGSSAVVNGVSEDKFSIGYSGIGYATPDVRAVPKAWRSGDVLLLASAASGFMTGAVVTLDGGHSLGM